MAGLQRTPAAYANEAALAISGRAGEEGAAAPRDRGARCPAPPHIAGSRRRAPRPPPVRLWRGPGAARAAVAAPPQGAGSKLWRRPRGAVSAGAPGSPLYRVSAPPPAPPPPPPGGPSRSERPRAGLRPGAFVSPGLLGRRASCSGRAGSAGRLHCSAAVLGAAQRGGPARAQVPPLSGPSRPAPRPLRGLPPAAGRARRLAAGAERSAHAGVAGLRQDQLSGSEAARAARLLPSFPSPACPLPFTPSSPRPPSRGPHRLRSARPARCRHRGRLAPAPARRSLCAAVGFLNAGKGGDRRTPVSPP